MQRYRKKPVVIEAVQVPRPEQVSPQDIDELRESISNMGIDPSENTNLSEICTSMKSESIAEWCGGVREHDAVDGPCILINTLEGQMKAVPGDWIIKGVQGEFYPCKPDIFAATYEVA